MLAQSLAKTLNNFHFSLVTSTIRFLVRIICRVDDEQLSHLPDLGPYILVSNHVNFMDAPAIFSHIQPRSLTALVKEETWESPLLGYLFTLWKAIPIKRGELDLTAFRAAQVALKNGQILAIAPEGTRSGDGVLGQGFPGTAVLAVKTGVTIIPMAVYGHEHIWENLTKLKRTDFHFAVGEPFRIDMGDQPFIREIRQSVTDEIMLQIAALLPQKYRGYYSDSARFSENFIRHTPSGTPTTHSDP